ncbi:type II secretion system F family protein [Kocuria tytonis]|uniref:Type II secretion system F family protein n=1 Tax=Kocuria tytonis TaxID=2054280 RepID=A0A495A9G9_9MICC|nr:type II secretion system F family protein [Kocuria tytonis]RKQ36696.1 type II secretion system F family protein [Kocuria tytonis]
MNLTLLSGLLGLVLALGLWLVLTAARAVGAPSFADRIAPQLRAAELSSALSGGTSWASRRSRGQSLTGLAGSVAMGWVLQRAAPLFSNADVLARRLLRDGSRKDVMDYRAEQVLSGVAGAVAGSVVGIALAVRADVNVAIVAVGTVLGAGAGVWLRNDQLSRGIRRREKRMLAEFPAVAELMALAVGAGESAVGALERVCRVAEGELAGEFRAVLAQTRAGSGLATALQDFSARTDVVALGRFVDGIVVAIERGTPLADVLRAQAQDVRDHDKRVLMEVAGKKEIAMLVPVVFFILPLSVMFAVFPGLAVLNLGF